MTKCSYVDKGRQAPYCETIVGMIRGQGSKKYTKHFDHLLRQLLWDAQERYSCVFTACSTSAAALITYKPSADGSGSSLPLQKGYSAFIGKYKDYHHWSTLQLVLMYGEGLGQAINGGVMALEAVDQKQNPRSSNPTPRQSTNMTTKMASCVLEYRQRSRSNRYHRCARSRIDSVWRWP